MSELDGHPSSSLISTWLVDDAQDPIWRSPALASVFGPLARERPGGYRLSEIGARLVAWSLQEWFAGLAERARSLTGAEIGPRCAEVADELEEASLGLLALATGDTPEDHTEWQAAWATREWGPSW